MIQYQFNIKKRDGREEVVVKSYPKEQKHVVLLGAMDEMMQDPDTVSVLVFNVYNGTDLCHMFSDTKTNTMSRHYDAELAAKEKAMLKEKAARARAEWLRKRQAELAKEVR